MQFVVRLILIITLATAAPSLTFAKDGGKPPEPKPRGEIIRQPKSDSKGHGGESSSDKQKQDKGGDSDRSREDRDKPHWVENS
jgi:hypothetical protein